MQFADNQRLYEDATTEKLTLSIQRIASAAWSALWRFKDWLTYRLIRGD